MVLGSPKLEKHQVCYAKTCKELLSEPPCYPVTRTAIEAWWMYEVHIIWRWCHLPWCSGWKIIQLLRDFSNASHGKKHRRGRSFSPTHKPNTGYCLVVTGTMEFDDFPYIVKNNPNWRTHILQRGRSATNQNMFGFLVRNGCGQPLAVLSFKVTVGCLGMRANRKVLPSRCHWIWAPNFYSSPISVFPSDLFVCCSMFELSCMWEEARQILPISHQALQRPAVALCPLRLVLPWTYRGFPTAVGDCGRTAWEPPDCQATKAAGRSIRWIRWIRPVLRRTDTSLRVRAPQIHQIPGFPGQTQFPAVSNEMFQMPDPLYHWSICFTVIPFWSILPIFCLCFFIAVGDSIPTLMEKPGQRSPTTMASPTFVQTRPGLNVLFPGDSTGNWGLTSSPSSPPSSSSSVIHDLGIPINQPMIGFEHCLNRSDDAWMVVHQNVLLMESSSLWVSAKSR